MVRIVAVEPTELGRRGAWRELAWAVVRVLWVVYVIAWFVDVGSWERSIEIALLMAIGVDLVLATRRSSGR